MDGPGPPAVRRSLRLTLLPKPMNRRRAPATMAIREDVVASAAHCEFERTLPLPRSYRHILTGHGRCRNSPARPQRVRVTSRKPHRLPPGEEADAGRDLCSPGSRCSRDPRHHDACPVVVLCTVVDAAASCTLWAALITVSAARLAGCTKGGAAARLEGLVHHDYRGGSCRVRAVLAVHGDFSHRLPSILQHRRH